MGGPLFLRSTGKFFPGLLQVLSFLPRRGVGAVPFKEGGGGGCRPVLLPPLLGPGSRGPRARAPRQRMRPPVGAVRAAKAESSRTDGRTDGLAAGRTHWAAQGAGTRRDSDMAGHTQQPSGRGNPGPAPSPSPGPGPGPGASERVALKKEIGLVSACTIIIGERGPGGRAGAWGSSAKGLGRTAARIKEHSGSGRPYDLRLWDASGDAQRACGVSPHTVAVSLLVPTSPGAQKVCT